MHISISNKLLVLFAFLILLIVGNYFLYQFVHNELEKRQRLSRHSSDVIVKSEVLLGHLRDAETGQRGYLLTLDPQYLEPYHKGVAKSDRLLTDLLEMVSENPVQIEVLEEIIRLKEQKFSELALTINHAGKGDLPGALKIVKEDTGKNLMDAIRDKLDSFQSFEHKSLLEKDARVKKTQETIDRLLFVEIFVLIGGIALTLTYARVRIVIPLLIMKRELEKVESGKESRGIHLKQDDEVGKLAKALNTMLERLRIRSEELEVTMAELENERDKALQISATDSLTGLANRRKFEQIGSRELKRAHRGNYSVNLIMIDIDYFKSINDIYGHAMGDNVLREVAACIQSMARRPNDYVFRMGGEEFVFLTSGMDEQTTHTFADSVRLNIEMLRIPNSGSEVSQYVTVSAGIATVKPDLHAEIYSIMQDADRRLYHAKDAGRNCVR